MPLQNRVNPMGELIADPGKGTLMGNRGCLHDAEKRLGRSRWKTKSWVTCALNFGGWKQKIMAPDHYTQLFFLDEATALAAGHRPCFTCRRDRFNAFLKNWQMANLPGETKIRVTQIDPTMHAERTLPILARSVAAVESLPDGAMVTQNGSQVWIKWRNGFHEWSFTGYGRAMAAPTEHMIVVTPPSTVAVLQSGYEPEIHHTLLT
jgi:hypothetical protein